MMVDKRKETWTWRPDTRSPSLPIRQYGAFYPGMGLGGSGVHWSGQLFRFTPFDFQLRTSYTQKYGQGILPPGSSIQDWPITYEELEPYYDAYEYDIGASGQVGNLGGQLIPGGNPFEAPRSRPYPLPPLPVTIPSNLFADACREVGYHPFPQPAAIASQAFRDPFGNYRSGCILCGFCTRYGCEVDAKSSPQTTYIPVALATGHYEIRYDAHVVRVNVGADGLATGVTYVDAQGQEHEQPADIVLLTGFTLSNVKLLLVSRGGRHPNGIGNDRGQVGRNCTHQYWTAPVAGVFKDRRFNLYMGNTCTQNTIYDLYESVIDHSGLGFIGGGGVYSTLGERTPIMSASAYPRRRGREEVGARLERGAADDLGWHGRFLHAGCQPGLRLPLLRPGPDLPGRLGDATPALHPRLAAERTEDARLSGAATPPGDGADGTDGHERAGSEALPTDPLLRHAQHRRGDHGPRSERLGHQ